MLWIDLQLFTIAMAKTLDSNYEAVSFDDSVDEQTRQIFLDVFDDYLKGITSLFNNDGDFIYKAVNTNTNQMISQHSEKITTNDDRSIFVNEMFLNAGNRVKNKRIELVSKPVK